MPSDPHSVTYTVIIANPNDESRDEIKSTHRTLYGAARSLRRLGYARWAYVAQRRPDGSYPSRDEAQQMNLHFEVMEACYDLERDQTLRRRGARR